MASYFELLPMEIRCQIFRHVFESPTGIISLSRTSYHRRPIRYKILAFEADESCGTIHLGLLRTSRQFYVDCHDLLWRYNTLDVEALWHESGRIKMFDKAIIDKVRSIQMDCNDVDTEPLEEKLRTFATWRSLQSIRIFLRDKFSHDPATWTHRHLKQWLQERTSGVKYPDLLATLKQAGGKEGYLEHLERRILLDTGIPSFTHEAFPSRYFSLSAEGDPSTILSELNGSFGGTLWVDGILSFTNSKCVKEVFLGSEVVVYASDLEMITVVNIISDALGWDKLKFIKAILTGNEVHKNTVFDRHPIFAFMRDDGLFCTNRFMRYVEDASGTRPGQQAVECPTLF